MRTSIELAHSYTSSERVGVVVLSLAGITSFAAILLTLTMKCFSPQSLTRTYRQTNFLGYFLSLLLSNIIQSVGTLMDMKWIAQNGLEDGLYCQIQGAVKQAGNVANAVWCFMVSIHLSNLLFRRSASTVPGFIITLLLGWGFTVSTIVVGPTAIQTKERGPYYGISGNWCWITSEYKREQVFLEYFLEFFSAGISFVVYMLVLLRVQGNLSISWVHEIRPGLEDSSRGLPREAMMRSSPISGYSEAKYSMTFITRKSLRNLGSFNDNRLDDIDTSRRAQSDRTLQVKWRFVRRGHGWKLSFRRDYLDASMLRVVKHMVWYPVVYTILIVPVGAARLSAVAGARVPEVVTFITAFVFNLTGLINVLLLLITHRLFPETATLPRFTTPRPMNQPPCSVRSSTTLSNQSTSNGTPTSGSEPHNQGPFPNKFGITPFLLYDNSSPPPIPRSYSPFNAVVPLPLDSGSP